MGFSIREFTKNMRTVDPYKCWPFPVGDLTREEIQARLLPMDVPMRSSSHSAAAAALTEEQKEEDKQRRVRNLARRRRNLNEIFDLKPDPNAIPAPPYSPPPPPSPASSSEQSPEPPASPRREELASDAESGGNSNSVEKVDRFCTVCERFIGVTKEREMDEHIVRCVEEVSRLEDEERRAKSAEGEDLIPFSDFAVVLTIGDSKEDKEKKKIEKRKIQKMMMKLLWRNNEFIRGLREGVAAAAKDSKVNNDEKRSMQKKLMKLLLGNNVFIKVMAMQKAASKHLKDTMKYLDAATVRRDLIGLTIDQVRDSDSVGNTQAVSPIPSNAGDIQQHTSTESLSLNGLIKSSFEKGSSSKGDHGNANLEGNRVDDDLAINIDNGNKDDACQHKVQNADNSSEEPTTGKNAVKVDDIDASSIEKALALTISSVEKKDQGKNCVSIAKELAEPLIQDVTEKIDHGVQAPLSELEGTANLEANRIDGHDLAIDMHKGNEDGADKLKGQNPANTSNELKGTSVKKCAKLDDIYASFWKKKLAVTISSSEEKNQAKNHDSMGNQQVVPSTHDDASNGCDTQMPSLGKHGRSSPDDEYSQCPKTRKSFGKTVFNSSFNALASSTEMGQSSREGTANLGANRNVDDLANNKHRGKEAMVEVSTPETPAFSFQAWKSSGMHTQLTQVSHPKPPLGSAGRFSTHQFKLVQPTFQSPSVNPNANRRTNLQPVSTNYSASSSNQEKESVMRGNYMIGAWQLNYHVELAPPAPTSRGKQAMNQPTVQQRPHYPVRLGIADNHMDLNIKDPFVERSKLQNMQNQNHRGYGMIPSEENPGLILPNSSQSTMRLMSNNNNNNQNLSQNETLGVNNKNASPTLHRVITPTPMYSRGVPPKNNPLRTIGQVNESTIPKRLTWREKFAALPVTESPMPPPPPPSFRATPLVMSAIPLSVRKRAAATELVNRAKANKMPAIQAQQQNSSATSQHNTRGVQQLGPLVVSERSDLNLNPRDHPNDSSRPVRSSNPVATTTITESRVGDPKLQENMTKINKF